MKVYKHILYNQCPKSRNWQTVGEKQKAQLFWNVRMQTDKPQIGNQQQRVITDTEQKTPVVINVVVWTDSSIERRQQAGETQKTVWKIKNKVVPLVIKPLCL